MGRGLVAKEAYKTDEDTPHCQCRATLELRMSVPKKDRQGQKVEPRCEEGRPIERD